VARNITFSLPEDLIRQAKVLAARRDRSLNALVREVLEKEVKSRDRYRKAAARLLEKTAEGLYEIPARKWNRGDLYE